MALMNRQGRLNYIMGGAEQTLENSSDNIEVQMGAMIQNHEGTGSEAVGNPTRMQPFANPKSLHLHAVQLVPQPSPAELKRSDSWEKAQQQSEGLIDITISSADHLPKMDMFGSVDGFVTGTFQKKAFKTQVKQNTFSPVWDETFTVQVAKVKEAGEFCLELFDWNTTQGDQLVGRANLDQAEMVKIMQGASGKKVTREIPLVDKKSSALKGHDKQPAHITVKFRPFLRLTRTESFRTYSRTNSERSLKCVVDVGNDRPVRTPLQTASTLSAPRLALMKDVINNSRFVHAQLWYLQRREMTLVYRGEHFTSKSFISEEVPKGDSNSKKLAELLALDETTEIPVGDETTVEGVAAARRATEAHELSSFVSNPEIVISERMSKMSELFYSCLVLPVKDTNSNNSQSVLAFLVLLAPHEESPAAVDVYQKRETNSKLFGLLDRILELMAYTVMWDATFPKYKQAMDEVNWNMRDRVRKLWFKLRLVVKCGWIRNMQNTPAKAPPNLTQKFKSWFIAYTNKFKGANAKAPPRADSSFAVWTFFGVFIGLLTLSAINAHGFMKNDTIPYTIMSGSFAALATLLFAAPASPFAQPKLVIAGHLLSTSVAVLVDYFVNTKFVTAFLPPWVASALTPALAISSMTLVGCINPPAGAAALIFASGNDTIKSYGWMWLLLPNLVGCIVMIIIALLLNNLSSKRKYPQFWW